MTLWAEMRELEHHPPPDASTASHRPPRPVGGGPAAGGGGGAARLVDALLRSDPSANPAQRAYDEWRAPKSQPQVVLVE